LPILWGFAFEDSNGTLNWCTKNLENNNKSHPVPVPVEGRTDKPFVLMSWPSKTPNLHAADVVDAYNATELHCFHFRGSDTWSGNEEDAVKMDPVGVESSLAMFERDFNAFN
jgi:hypothetical protein